MAVCWVSIQRLFILLGRHRSLSLLTPQSPPLLFELYSSSATSNMYSFFLQLSGSFLFFCMVFWLHGYMHLPLGESVICPVADRGTGTISRKEWGTVIIEKLVVAQMSIFLASFYRSRNQHAHRSLHHRTFSWAIWIHPTLESFSLSSVSRCVCKIAKKANITLVMSVRLSAWNNSEYAWWIFMKLDIRVFFEKLQKKIQVSLKFG